MATATVASNTLWASMLKPLKYAAGILAAVVATISSAGKGSSLSEGFNFKPEDLKFKADKEPIVKVDKIKEAKKEIVSLGDAFSVVQIQVKKAQFAIGSLADSAPKQISYLVESSGQSLNRLGVLFDEIGKTIGGWANLVGQAMTTASVAIGEALMSGDFSKVGEAIVKQLGAIAVQIGAALLAIGIPLAAVGIPKGFAYVAGGVALGIIGGAMMASGKASGASNSGSTGQANYSGSFMPSFQGTQYLMLDGKVRGQDLVIATGNTNRDNRRVR